MRIGFDASDMMWCTLCTQLHLLQHNLLKVQTAPQRCCCYSESCWKQLEAGGMLHLTAAAHFTAGTMLLHPPMLSALCLTMHVMQMCHADVSSCMQHMLASQGQSHFCSRRYQQPAVAKCWPRKGDDILSELECSIQVNRSVKTCYCDHILVQTIDCRHATAIICLQACCSRLATESRFLRCCTFVGGMSRHG